MSMTDVPRYRDIDYALGKLSNAVTPNIARLFKIYGSTIGDTIRKGCTVLFCRDGLLDGQYTCDISKSISSADLMYVWDIFKPGHRRISVGNHIIDAKMQILVKWNTDLTRLSLNDRIIDFFLYTFADTKLGYLKEVEMAGVFGEIYALYHCSHVIDIHCNRYLIWSENTQPEFHQVRIPLTPELANLQSKYTKIEFYRRYFRWKAARRIIHPKHRKTLDRLFNSEIMAAAANRIGLDVIATNVIQYLEKDL